MIEHLQLVSIKVPRTGSESLGQVLLRAYGNRELKTFVQNMDFNPKIYDPDSWYYRDPNPAAPFQAELEEFKPYDDRQYFHNHVPYKMVEGLWGYAPFITFLREPVSWLISCYWYAKQLKHIPDEMGIWDYVELDYRRNWMTMLVSDINRYDFIGFQESWRHDVMMLVERYLNVSTFWTDMIPTLNVQADVSYIRFAHDMAQDKMFIRRVKKIHKDDFELYKEAKDEFATAPR